MSKVARYHSALHESDNRYHVHADCPWGNEIITRCTCDRSRTIRRCRWCDAKRR